MRRNGRVDANQRQITEALRQAGASVQVLSSVGGGCPDLLIGICGLNILIEIKDGAKLPSAQKLTDDETLWHEIWRGQVCVVRSVDEALTLLERVREQA